ncbi:MAG: hypothetical protein KKE02_07950 [Alphaproteobacteria bacterium]|nr:hypothetical protein [Alphaproteobacteria bacterium]MBU1515644.1 hypothetical protein [Alphaproteobacteria bacterium]MBU2094903.1 hypothetical protein [Alphaproteobacteria bacterium]MBU2150935.1 hypothetical protein [Alphaproteobacteria bacterium]MBU2305912.1 hypothetical protein [Alphaproteobacteria bacterium]
MAVVTLERWRELVLAYEAAGAKSDAALAASEADSPGVMGSAEDRHYEACWAAFMAAEDRLLTLVAPSFEGIAFQLHVFAERFHQADLSGPESRGEEQPAGEILRCILAGLEHLSGRSLPGPTAAAEGLAQ